MLSPPTRTSELLPGAISVTVTVKAADTVISTLAARPFGSGHSVG